MKDKWTMEMDQKGLYNGGKTSIRGGIEKYYKERLEKIYCSTRKNIPSEIAYPFKNLLLRCKFNLRLYVYSSLDRFRTLINC